MASNYEQEIEELLSQLGDFTPKETGTQRFLRKMQARARAWWRFLTDLPNTLAPDQLMITAIIFIAAAYFLRFVMPGAARFVGLFGIVLLLAAFYFSFQQLFGMGQREVRWRGQRLDVPDGQQSSLVRLVLWLRRQFRSY